MSTSVAITDLKRMTASELRKEIMVKRAEAAKMRMGLEMQSEKNHAAYRVAKRDLARMSMVLADMEKSAPSGKAGKANNEAKTASKSEENAVKDSGPQKKKAKVSAKKKS
jgi:ribosomal protein L29